MSFEHLSQESQQFMADLAERAREEKARKTREAEEARKAPRVLARYLTLAGQSLCREDIAVAVTEMGPRDSEFAQSTKAACSGCRAGQHVHWDTYPWRSLSDVHEHVTVAEAAEAAEREARRWADEHAPNCREIPVQEATR